MTKRIKIIMLISMAFVLLLPTTSFATSPYRPYSDLVSSVMANMERCTLSSLYNSFTPDIVDDCVSAALSDAKSHVDSSMPYYVAFPHVYVNRQGTVKYFAVSVIFSSGQIQGTIPYSPDGVGSSLFAIPNAFSFCCGPSIGQDSSCYFLYKFNTASAEDYILSSFPDFCPTIYLYQCSYSNNTYTYGERYVPSLEYLWSHSQYNYSVYYTDFVLPYDTSEVEVVDDFFSSPPLNILIRTAVKVFRERTLWNSQILLLCGVGLVVLLIGLKLFPKVLNRYVRR